jgi:hypothetical protein
MAYQQLIDYIKAATAQGQSPEQIRAALLGVGWQTTDVNAAFAQIAASSKTHFQPVRTPVQPAAAVRSATPQTNTPANNKAPAQNDRPYFRAVGQESIAPSATASSTITPAKPTTLPAKKLSGLAIALLTLAIIVFLGAGSAAAYFFVFKQDPNEVLNEAVANELSSLSRTINLNIAGSVDNSVSNNFASSTSTQTHVSVKVDAQEKFDRHDVNDLKAGGNISVTVDTSSPGSSMQFKGSFEHKTVSGATYVHITELPSVLALVVPIDQITNQWIRFDVAGAQEAAQTFGKTDSAFNKLTPEQTEQFAMDFHNEVVTRAKATPILTVNTVLPDVESDGGKAYHYDVHFNADTFKSIVVASLRAVNQKDNLGMTDQDFTNIETDFSRILGQVAGLQNADNKIVVTIGKKDHVFREITANWNRLGPDNTSAPFSLHIDLPIADRNTDMNITVPSDAVDLQTLISELMATSTRATTTIPAGKVPTINGIPLPPAPPPFGM